MNPGAKFATEIETQTSPLASFLLTFLLPMAIFIGLGQYLSRRMMQQLGGKNALQFPGMGKSSAKVYVQSTDASTLTMWPARTRPREPAEIVDYLHNPQKYTEARCRHA